MKFKDLTQDEWARLCYERALSNPEDVGVTMEAFSLGVRDQAQMNQEKVSNMALALSMVYDKPTSKQWRELARTRLLESGYFSGTPFGERLESDLAATP